MEALKAQQQAAADAKMALQKAEGELFKRGHEI